MILDFLADGIGSRQKFGQHTFKRLSIPSYRPSRKRYWMKGCEEQFLTHLLTARPPNKFLFQTTGFAPINAVTPCVRSIHAAAMGLRQLMMS